MKLRFAILPMILAGALCAQVHGFRGGSLTPPTPAELVQRQVNFLTKFFGLSTSQVSDVTGFLTTEQTCLQGNSTNLQSARDGLVTAIKSGSSAAVSTAVTALSGLQAAQETCRATAAAAIYGNLNSAQQMKLGNGLGPLLGGGARFGRH